MALDTRTPRTRRAILAGALGAAAAVGIDAIARPAPAQAATSFVVLGGPNTSAATTEVTNVTPGLGGIFGGASGNGAGVQGASDSGWGVYGRVGSTAGTGVFGIAPAASGATIGVRGDSLSTNGIGALGIVAATSGFTYGVDGRSHSPRGIGTRGLAFGNGTGVLGWSGATTPPQAKAGATVGVQGYASQNAASVGVRGDSTTGRGGLFNGKAAQVRLLPSTAATHPTSGQKGDLFVDTAGRLWFCKGATSWKQLA